MFLVKASLQMVILLAVMCASRPRVVRAARQAFTNDDSVKLAGPERHTGKLINRYFDVPETLLEESDVVDLLYQVYVEPMGSYGNGGYGCYASYGYGAYGYCGGHPPGGFNYGDDSRESDEDFEELINLGAALEMLKNLNHGHTNDLGTVDHGKYDVYGMDAASVEERMNRRVLRMELQGWEDQRDDMPAKVPFRLAEVVEDYSEWEELLGSAFHDVAPKPQYGRYRGGAYGYYDGCLGSRYGGYGGVVVVSCGGGYGGDHMENLLYDPLNLELQEALLEIRELLKYNVQKDARTDLEHNMEEGELSALLPLEELL